MKPNVPRQYDIEQRVRDGRVHFHVVEYDDVRRVKTIMSIHRSRAEAEAELELAKTRRHSTQLEPGGTL